MGRHASRRLRHEAAGRVSALGAGVAKVAVGDRVLVTLIRSCGTCPDCASGKPVYCTGKAPREAKLTDDSGAPGACGDGLRRLCRKR